jgi:hypothetical protein
LLLGNIVNTNTAGLGNVGFDINSTSAILESGTIQLTIQNTLTPDITDSSGSIGIRTTSPGATLSVVGSGASQLSGSVLSSAFLVSGGSLGTTKGSDLTVGSIGGMTPAYSESLGVDLYRTAADSGWENTTSIGIGMDVGSLKRVGGTVWLSSNGTVGIGTATPGAKLDVVGNLRLSGSGTSKILSPNNICIGAC